jgi:hypothetical protein
MPSTFKHLWLARLIVLAGSLGLGLACLELIARAGGADRPLLWEPHPRLGWWHIPGAARHWVEEGDGWVEINSLGLRDVERTIAKPPGVVRIAVFGDSVTEAVQVNLSETFCQLLERRLRDRGHRVEVLNFGVNGYSPLQAYLLYNEIGKAFDPDLVLHVVFLDNDIADLHRGLASGDRGAPFLDGASDDWKVDYSAAEASYRDYRRQPIFLVRRWSATYRAVSAARSAWIQNAYVTAGAASNQGIPKRYLLYEHPQSELWQDAWKRFERVIARFAAEVRADGARYAMVSAPAGQIVHPSAWDQLLKGYPAMQERQWQRMGPEHALNDLSVRRGLDLVAPFDAFAERASGAPLFFGGIGHLTPRGHQVMADFLEESLTARSLLPRP